MSPSDLGVFVFGALSLHHPLPKYHDAAKPRIDSARNSAPCVPCQPLQKYGPQAGCAHANEVLLELNVTATRATCGHACRSRCAVDALSLHHPLPKYHDAAKPRIDSARNSAPCVPCHVTLFYHWKGCEKSLDFLSQKSVLRPASENRIMSVYGFSRTVVPHLLQQIVD